MSGSVVRGMAVRSLPEEIRVISSFPLSRRWPHCRHLIP